MKNRSLILVPLVSVLVIVPALLSESAGIHENLYGGIATLVALPALFAIGKLRDAGVELSNAAWGVLAAVFQFGSYLLVTWLVIAINRWVKSKRAASVDRAKSSAAPGPSAGDRGAP